MRTIKELLQVMLDNKHRFMYGLCNIVYRLYSNDIISFDEYQQLQRYIARNRPSKFSSIDAFKRRKSNFYWEMGNIKPRIKWLKKHIAKNS